MRGHCHRHIGKRREGNKVNGFESLSLRIDDRQGQMAVGRGPAMPGYVLDDREHAALKQACHMSARKADHPFGHGRIGAVADDLAAARLGNIKHRKAVDSDADVEQILRHQPPDPPRRSETCNWIALRKLAKTASRGIFPPGIGGRAQSLDPPALLVNEYRRVAPRDRLAKTRR